MTQQISNHISITSHRKFEQKKKYFKVNGFRKSTRNNFEYPVFDFSSNPNYFNLIQKIIQDTEAFGIKRNELLTIWNETTGTSKHKINQFLKGEKMMELWEYVEITNKIKTPIKTKNNLIPKDRFFAKIMYSTEGAFLILKAYYKVQFTLIFNMDDYKEWRLATVNNNITHHPQKKELLNEIIMAIKWYFTKRNPIDLRIFKSQFNIKFIENQFKKIQNHDQPF